MVPSRVLVCLITGLAMPGAVAFELSDRLAVGVAGRGLIQHGVFHRTLSDDGGPVSNRTRGTAIVDLDLDYHPTDRDTLYTAARWAKGNALNDTVGLQISPYGGDLEDDVKDVANRNRNYLLVAWYRHRFEFSEAAGLVLTGGLIDSSSYLDLNAFAGDQDAQFMNELFVQNNLASIPAYDAGVAVEGRWRRWSLNTVVMRAKNELDRNYLYYGAQLGVALDGGLGAGNYRGFAFTTSGDFADPNRGIDSKHLMGWGLSADQWLGDSLGLFARVGWQNHASVEFDNLFSAGIQLSGRLWGRAQDQAGLALAHVHGQNHSNIDHSNLAEAYVRFQLGAHLDLSVDVQYETTEVDDRAHNPRAWILGTRLNSYF